MFRSPNTYFFKNNDPYAYGVNQLKKQFKWTISALLSTEYYAGSDYGKIYSERRADGKSKIYVDQKDLEDRLQLQFMDLNEDVTKFLVGATGVGKTTLIRNFFKVFGRDVVEENGNLIIYVSLYSMVSAKENIPEKSLISAIDSSVREAITYISGLKYIDRLKQYDDQFYSDFFDFIEINNNHLIHLYPESPEYTEKLKLGNPKKTILNYIMSTAALDYDLSLLKYYIHIGNDKQFQNLIFIIDDIEGLNLEHTNIIVETMLHVKKCLQAKRTNLDDLKMSDAPFLKDRERTYNVKTLIAARNYSFRNIRWERKRTAYREINRSDVILKDTVPPLSEIINARVNCLENNPHILEKYVKKQVFIDESKKLIYILKNLYGKYDDMLLALTHNNIFLSMKLLMRIITNKQFVGKDEIDIKGAFDIDPSIYSSVSNKKDVAPFSNDDVFFALSYGEGNMYVDGDDYYLTNIMHYKKHYEIDTRILGIYIIQNLISSNMYFDKNGYDFELSIEGTEISNRILELFNFPSKDEVESFKKGLTLMLKHLYEGGILLQSIIEPKYDDAKDYKREYCPDMKIYLSRRGVKLYEMLGLNSLLMQVYRDDIDTDLENNDVGTVNLNPVNRILYIIQYVRGLFEIEAGYLRLVNDKEKYYTSMGSQFATVILMRGIKESIDTYYVVSSEREQIVKAYNDLAKDMEEFICDYNEADTYKFENVENVI
ncbi:MAG: hypothetical protein HDR23_00860 [Lachnospiraceae bacterium]|nr:hypothetical protein [Lachnospiraceae bacterium]